MTTACCGISTVFCARGLYFLAATLLAGCASLPTGEDASGLAGIDKLTPEARTIVTAVIAEAEFAEICAGGPPALREAVRSATVRAMFAGGLEEPRASGTAAGHFLADRCREINPDF